MSDREELLQIKSSSPTRATNPLVRIQLRVFVYSQLLSLVVVYFCLLYTSIIALSQKERALVYPQIGRKVPRKGQVTIRPAKEEIQTSKALWQHLSLWLAFCNFNLHIAKHAMLSYVVVVVVVHLGSSKQAYILISYMLYNFLTIPPLFQLLCSDPRPHVCKL